MLIDFDQSRKNNTSTINWNHPNRNAYLTFAHDVEQVRRLIKNVVFDKTSGIDRFLEREHSSIQDILDDEFLAGVNLDD